MKLLYIANIRIPTEKAHGLQIMKMCEAFAKNSESVELIVPRRINYIKENPFNYYNVKGNFKITKLPCIDTISMPLGRVGFWIEFLSFVLSVKIYLLFKREYKIYTRDFGMGFFFKDFLYEVHALPQKLLGIRLLPFKKAKLVAVLTNCIKNELITAGIMADKIIVTPDAVDIDEFDISITKEEARNKLNLPQSKKLVGYVGMLRTMGMEKGVDNLLKAITKTSESTILIVVGGSVSDIEFYIRFSEELGIKDRVIFTGMVKHNLVPQYLKAMDVLVASYPKGKHFECYMSPLKIFEYMASGVPMVVSDLPSIREVLNESNSMLVDSSSPANIAENINKILQSKDLSDSTAKQAYEDVQGYTWAKRANIILHCI